MKQVEILKERKAIDSNGIGVIYQLRKEYKLLSSGREFDIEYVYESKVTNGFCGIRRSFKKLANALKYCESIFEGDE